MLIYIYHKEKARDKLHDPSATLNKIEKVLKLE
jgi:hypothetical protein